jgi:hypothetical protein
MLSSVYLAAEDLPGLAVGRKLVSEYSHLHIFREENGHGFGRLKSKIKNYNQMGKHGLPVLLLTDLDSDPCPSAKIKDWLGHAPSSGFLFRICIREIEAWLLADREAMASFLKVKVSLLPINPETLCDPKGKLIELAQKAPRALRVGITPIGRSSIGPDYNDLLQEFISDCWSLERAASVAPSLARARQRVAELARAASVRL